MSSLAWQDVGAGPVVVLLHAFPCDHSMWEQQVPNLVEAGWRVLVPDLPGFGSSSLPAHAPSLTVVVDEIIAGLLERSIDRCVVAGLSVGGYLVMEWLRRRPEMLAAIVLCDTKGGADAQTAREARLGMAAAIDADTTRCADILRERVLPVIVGSTTARERPDVVATVVRWMEQAAPASVSWYQRAMAARPESLSSLTECALPVLIVWGDQDGMAPRDEQEAMLAALRDARLVVVPEAGHLTAIEAPSEVSTALVDFLGAVRGAHQDG